MSKSPRMLFILIVSILPLTGYTQVWVATYNGPGNFQDRARAVIVDDGQNVYVAGSSGGLSTSSDYATVRYNAAGVEQWVARYNGPGNDYDYVFACAIDNKRNVYTVGGSRGLDTDCDYATVKYDSSGVEQWVTRYNGPIDGYDLAFAVAVDSTGNIYVTGYSPGYGFNNDYTTVKYDSSGIEQWVTRYDGPIGDDDQAIAMVVDDAGNVYVTGFSHGFGYDGDYATVKYNTHGAEQWVVRYDGPVVGDNDVAHAIAIDAAGNVYVTGESPGEDYDLDYVTVKYNSSGVEQWVARYDGSDQYVDYANALAVDVVGNVYVTGGSYGAGFGLDYATIMYDSLGTLLWVAEYEGSGNGQDVARAIAVGNDCGVHVTGYSIGSGTDEDYATVKYDTSGNELWVARYDGPGNNWDEAYAIAVDNMGYVYVTGQSYGLGTYHDYATIKYSPLGVEEDRLTIKKGNEITATVFRGPLQLPERKKCRVFDITGRIVIPETMEPGIYFIEVDGEIIQKIVKIK